MLELGSARGKLGNTLPGSFPFALPLLGVLVCENQGFLGGLFVVEPALELSIGVHRFLGISVAVYVLTSSLISHVYWCFNWLNVLHSLNNIELCRSALRQVDLAQALWVDC